MDKIRTTFYAMAYNLGGALCEVMVPFKKQLINSAKSWDPGQYIRQSQGCGF
jgi:hypothetical protein